MVCISHSGCDIRAVYACGEGVYVTIKIARINARVAAVAKILTGRASFRSSQAPSPTQAFLGSTGNPFQIKILTYVMLALSKGIFCISDFAYFRHQSGYDFEIGVVDDDAWDTLKQVAQQASSAKGAFDYSKYLLSGASNGTATSTSSNSTAST